MTGRERLIEKLSDTMDPTNAAEFVDAVLTELNSDLRAWLEKSIDRSAQKAKEAVEKDDRDTGMAALGALGALQLVQKILSGTPEPSEKD